MTLKRLLKAAKKQGFSARKTGSGHWLLTPPTKGLAMVTVASTASDHRSMRNTLALLKKSGFAA